MQNVIITVVIVVVAVAVVVVIVVVGVVVVVSEDALNCRAEVIIVSTPPLDSCRGPWFAVVKRGHESCTNPCNQVSSAVMRCASVGSLLTFG